MTKKEITEVKKFYSKKNCSIRRVTGCYVNAEGIILGKFNDLFLNKEEDERLKYVDLIKNGLTGPVGKKIRTFDFPNENEMKDSLLALRNSELKETELLDSFYQKVIESYHPDKKAENYLIFVINNTMDIFQKGADGKKQADSEEVYNYISGYVCPVKIEKRGLTFNNESGNFVQTERRQCVQTPTVSFIYPSFEDHHEDANCITIFTKKSDHTYSQFIEDFFSFHAILSPKEQMEGFENIVENSIPEDENKMDVIKSIQELLTYKIESSKETVKLNQTEIKDLLIESGISQEALSTFDADYESKFGGRLLSAESILHSKVLEVKVPDIIVKVNQNKTNMVQSKEVDGHNCLVINIEDEDEVLVNGIVL